MSILDRYSYELFCERLDRQGVSRKVEYLDNFKKSVAIHALQNCAFITVLLLLCAVFIPEINNISFPGGLFLMFVFGHTAWISRSWAEKLKKERFHE